MARFCDSNQKRGLTLVELIVVLVILAVLAALLVPSLTGYIDKAVEKRIMLQVTMDDAMLADEVFTLLMGDKVEPRREFIEQNSKLVTDLDI